MNLPDPNADWLEAVAGRRLPPAAAAALRQRLATRPRELARLAEELALNAALEAGPVPPPATNFAAQVWTIMEMREFVSQ